MPIVIQELIASDTISQAVDKINFNFDQLILNGGGPSGPPGIQGPRGPIGGRGQRGSRWYEDTLDKPGVPPTGLIFTDLVEDDNYLQSNGDVWTWDGSAWNLTGVNLTGPQGNAGISAGFSFFGGDPPSERLQTSIYPAPFISTGANNINEGISTGVFGAAISADTLPAGSPGYSVLPDSLATSIDSSRTSVFVHQKTSGSKSIIFHGGTLSADYFEQTDIDILSNISIGVDDTLVLNSPKEPQNPASDLIGIRVLTGTRGQQFRAGKHIEFTTGVNDTAYPAGVNDTSNFTVNVNGYSSLDELPKISLNVLYTGNTASLDIGGLGTIPNSTTKSGKIISEANNIGLVGNLIKFNSNANTNIQISTNGISLSTGSGDVDISSSSDDINITAGSEANVTATGGITMTSAGSGVIINTTSTTINSPTTINSSLSVSNDTQIGGDFLTVGESTLDDEITVNTVNDGTGDILVRDSNNKVKKIPDAGPIPIGGIIMWSGDINTSFLAPLGWALCNGQTANGTQTPDLRQRFIVGQGVNPNVPSIPGGFNIDSTGGSGTITPSGVISIEPLQSSMVPRHTHMFLGDDNIYTNGSSNGGPGYNGNSTSDQLAWGGGPNSWSGTSVDNLAQEVGGYDADSDGNGRRSAFFTGVNNMSVQSTTLQNTTPTAPQGQFNGIEVPSLPPYYALAFIMYVGPYTP